MKTLNADLNIAPFKTRFRPFLDLMKQEGQLQERDIEPLILIPNSIGLRFVQALHSRARVVLRTNLGADMAQYVNREFSTESTNRLANVQTKAFLDLDRDDDSDINTKSLEFHTMTALGRNRANLQRGVMRAMSSIPGGVTAMIQYLFLLDENDEPTAAKFFFNVPGQTFSDISLETNLESSDTGINGLYLVHYIANNKDYVGIQYWQNREYPAADPVINAPVQNNINQNYHNIVIGLGRGTRILRVHADADYTYSNPNNINKALVPFQGSVLFGSNIKPLNQQSLRAKFYLTTAGGSVRQVQNKGNHWDKYIKISANNPRQLEWNWPESDLAFFGNTDWGVDKAAYLHFEVGVKTDNSPNQFVYAQIHSMDKDFVPTSLRITDSLRGRFDDVVDGIGYTYPVEHSWHCVTAGTMVTMADGGLKPIDDVIGGEELRIGDEGLSMEVRSTVEQSVMETDTVYNLTDSLGNALRITGDHWVAVPDGYKPAEELSKGDTILTTSGPATVKSIRKVKYDGKVFSLSLGNHEKRPNIGFEGTTFFANNILIADNQLCRIQNLLRLKDRKRAAAQLSDPWKAVADALHAI